MCKKYREQSNDTSRMLLIQKKKKVLSWSTIKIDIRIIFVRVNKKCVYNILKLLKTVWCNNDYDSGFVVTNGFSVTTDAYLESILSFKFFYANGDVYIRYVHWDSCMLLVE